ncbi:MAG: tRNA epoxyqueuosine(34) reductase QueG [Candidatus Amulumruptor caecigallinarius]|nr:tRNA epoxyqueuosine(34) reductase QueG [Candidatus Amulumruptor caecigallinarius]
MKADIGAKERLADLLGNCGAVAMGVSQCCDTAPEMMKAYESWLALGRQAGMEYLSNHMRIRSNPGLLLDGCKSIVSIAFSYNAPTRRCRNLPVIADYAQFPDYHDRIRELTGDAIKTMKEEYGGDYRTCVDSAPIFERYRAAMSGIGIIGDNGALIVPGVGSKVFLAEILTTLEMESDTPLAGDCGRCGACRNACPTGALMPDGTIDSNLCLSYLTIEHRGEWTDEAHMKAMHTAAGRNTLFGCDICINVCPHNKLCHITAESQESRKIPQIFRHIDMADTLGADEIMQMGKDDFSKIFKGSCMKRAKLAGLRRNAENILARHAENRGRSSKNGSEDDDTPHSPYSGG